MSKYVTIFAKAGTGKEKDYLYKEEVICLSAMPLHSEKKVFAESLQLEKDISLSFLLLQSDTKSADNF